MGAPTGFEDVVAWLTPIADAAGRPAALERHLRGRRRRRAAAKADELGGKVLLPPMDAPYVRMTVLSDPQGAVFTASKYMPPG